MSGIILTMDNIDYKSYKKLKYYVKSGDSFSSSIPEWNTFAEHQFIDDIPESQRDKSGYRHRVNEAAKRYVAEHRRNSIIKWSLQIITYLLVITGIVISLLKP